MNRTDAVKEVQKWASHESRALWFLNRLEERHWLLAQATEARVARQSLIRRIAELQVGGQVAVWESGRDCDSVRYRGFKCLIPATVAEFDALYEHEHQWADGPFCLWVESPLLERQRCSRDLALEAFEDGHSHVIYD
jgi:hypothetical protein